MRIAHITSTFLPYLAGTGYVAYYQAKELARLGHDVHVFTAAVQDKGYHDTQTDIKISRLPALFRVGNVSLLPELLRLSGFDIVHLHYPFPSGAELVWVACSLRRIPYLINYHNDLIGVGIREKIFRLYNRTFGSFVIQRATAILAVTHDHAQNCQATSLFVKYNKPILELNNGVDIDHFHPHWDGCPLRQAFGIDSHIPVILFVAALDKAHHFKGLSMLLKAFHQIKNEQAQLVIVGAGELLDDFRSEANASGLNGRVHFAGRVAHADLPAYYAAADMVVLPSSPPESFGMVIIEGMACGKPVIGSRIPGVRTLIDEGVNGLLFEAGSIADLAAKLTTLIDAGPEERQRLGAAGRQKAETRFAWPQVGLRLEAIYRQTLDQSI